MKLFNVEQIRAWDAFTIQHEPISSLDLMERAATAFIRHLFCSGMVESCRNIQVFCGMGNNGGDGLVISRLLQQAGFHPTVWIIRHSDHSTPDFDINLSRYEHEGQVQWLSSADEVRIQPGDLLIDALLGSGLTRSVSGLLAEVIQKVNASKATVISVDIASGLFADQPNATEDAIIEPTHTISFQIPKLAFLLPKNARFVGKWHCVDIGLSPQYAEQTPTSYYFTDAQALPSLSDRESYSNKGTYGHALIIAGSYGKIGAAVLSSRACLRSGVGLLTVQIPACGYPILQTTTPEAMCLADQAANYISELKDLSKYTALGIGPGLDKQPETLQVLKDFLGKVGNIPTVMDADALNMLSENRELLKILPTKAILTPHPKEFERLLGHSWKDDYEKLTYLMAFCQTHQVTVVLKGQHTVVASPDGEFHFNSTGNPGMATGGTGDILTGILTALLAQGLEPKEAAILGVYRHGEAGDRAMARRGQIPLIASDLIEALRW
ncbi:MAG: NAD(P)H-hydrate dehydratase [Siphonobacter sp.]